MSNIVYFIPKKHLTPERKMILKFVPKNIDEAHKADTAEKVLTIEQYVYYLALVLIHQAYHFVPNRHQIAIIKLVNAGILDDLAVSTKTNLTNSCVTDRGEFFYNNIEFELPEGYTARMRVVDENKNIFVEAFSEKGKRRVYQFMYYKSNYKYTWKRIDDNPEALMSLLIDT